MAAFTTYQYGFKVSGESDGKLYLTYNPSDPSELIKFQITWNGFEEQKRWNNSTQAWQVMQSQPSEDCENYNYCGNFGVCTPSGSPRCSCLQGFEPRHPDQWRLGNWSGGCERRSPLQCQRSSSNGGEDGFKAVRCTKLPDFADKYRATSDDCKKRCENNCSCTAYAYVDAIGCMLWNGDLTDVQNHIQSGNTMHVRLAYSELGDHSSRMATHVIVLIVLAGLAFLAISVWLLWLLRKRLKAISASVSTNHELQVYDLNNSKEYTTDLSGPGDLVIEASQVNGPDLPMFNFNYVASATDNFSEENKLGEGGFGLVYKAWDLWSEGKAMEMVDPSIRDSCDEIEVLRCIQLGMLCVQDSALHRPNMASVVLMLESSTTSVPLPRQPTFTSVRASIDTEILMEAQEIASSNDLTVTMVAGR
ncbi:hypothetical protein OIU77_009514 [Salix suchowensis]|uniref:non-specific serine/threonine protein kinase n=1 Tax=Salix suchowensis TaxID=1278906 RepID=A0ABQ9AEI2_9ROSI|nr:hypothetical protein OIU77_009514 [Salix suchowensis]